tara:strand:+ start:127 stop:672 length:546 start_codon:yes stop_codon:yes gene_type:complete
MSKIISWYDKSIIAEDSALSIKELLVYCIKKNIRMKYAKLDYLDLRGMDLSGLKLNLANLQGSDLSGCNLTNINFQGCFCSGVKFNNSNLTKCNLAKIAKSSFDERTFYMMSLRSIVTEGLMAKISDNNYDFNDHEEYWYNSYKYIYGCNIENEKNTLKNHDNWNSYVDTFIKKNELRAAH